MLRLPHVQFYALLVAQVSARCTQPEIDASTADCWSTADSFDVEQSAYASLLQQDISEVRPHLHAGVAEQQVAAMGALANTSETRLGGGSPAPSPSKANLLHPFEPPNGVWRGTTFTSPLVGQQFEQIFNHHLHIWRTFHYPGDWSLSSDETDWINSGSILFYSIQPSNWKTFADSTIQSIAKVIGSVAPAQVMVAMGYEPDGHTQTSGDQGIVPTSEVYGTAADFKALWKRTRQIFQQEKVTNAKFVLDYSTRIATVTWPQAAEIWPGNGEVDWLFWNIFQNESATSCSTVLELAYKNFAQSSSGDHEYTSIPWGLGAWATFCQDWNGDAIPTGNRKQCLTGVANALESGDYPKLKASIYFNSGESVIVPTDTHPVISSPYVNSPELVADLTEHWGTKVYMRADESTT